MQPLVFGSAVTGSGIKGIGQSQKNLPGVHRYEAEYSSQSKEITRRVKQPLSIPTASESDVEY